MPEIGKLSELGELQSILSKTASEEELRPVIEKYLFETVRTRPKVIVDVLFPVIFPAIRRSVVSAIQAMVEDLNQLLEKSLSFRSFRWRIEAIRTKKTFSEIVLLHSVGFEVLDVLLIHRSTGLLLLHVSSGSAGQQDAAIISSLLPTIQDFVRESFRQPESGELDRLQMGEYTLWIESGPLALVAAKTRGYPSKLFHEKLHKIVETVHEKSSLQLSEFGGDTSAFLQYRPNLKECFQLEPELQKTGFPVNKVHILLTLLFTMAMFWVIFSFQRAYREKMLVQELEKNPGVFITQHSRRDGKTVVKGLRDVLSPDLRTVVKATGLNPDRVILDLQPYFSLDPKTVVLRAGSILSPPAKVNLEFSGSILALAGEASYSWLKKARQEYQKIAGVEHLDEGKLKVSEQLRFQELQNEITAQKIYFDTGSTRLSDESTAILDQMVKNLKLMGGLATEMDRSMKVTVIAGADDSGSEEFNRRLIKGRSQAVIRYLKTRGIETFFNVAPAEVEVTSHASLQRMAGLQIELL